MALNLDKIKAITLDVDGVMTDGSLIGLGDQEMLRIYNAKDSFGIRVAVMNGYKVAIFTGGETPGILNRFLTCGVAREDIHMGCRGKLKIFKAFCEQYGLDPSEVAYFGDDIPDVPVLKAAGLGIAPADAALEARAAADYVSPFGGGKFCVRHGIEMILRAQGTWKFDEGDYERLF
ncbi:MAG: HAD hydrolase family protein [Bacteroidales bacterium]|nr:HAD hydrolase family protein [Bacteroidales bacterium]